MKKINIAMLSNQQPSSPEAVNFDDDFDEVNNTVQGGLDELSVSMMDLETIDQVVSETIDVSMDLVDEQSAVQQAQEQGQVSQTALESIQRNVNRLVKKACLKPTASFAMESYSNPHYNTMAMESALKTIKEFIKKIWDAIKAAFEKVKLFITDILKKYFDESKKVKKRVIAVKNKATSSQGKMAPAGYAVGSYNLATYMRLNNHPLSPSELVANFDKWTSENHAFIENIAGRDAIDEYKDYVSDAMKVLQSYKNHMNLDKLQAEADEISNKLLNRIYSNLPNKKVITGGFLYQSKQLPGDVVYSFRTTDMDFELCKIYNYKNLPTQNTHEPIGVVDVITLSEKIEAHMNSYDNIEAHLKDLDHLKNEIDELAQAAIDDKNTTGYIENKIITTIVGKTIKLFIKAIGKVGVGARHYDMNMDKAALEWCELSIKPL